MLPSYKNQLIYLHYKLTGFYIMWKKTCNGWMWDKQAKILWENASLSTSKILWKNYQIYKKNSFWRIFQGNF